MTNKDYSDNSQCEPKSTCTNVTEKLLLQESEITESEQETEILPSNQIYIISLELIRLLVRHSGLLLTLDLIHNLNENYNHYVPSPGRLITCSHQHVLHTRRTTGHVLYIHWGR